MPKNAGIFLITVIGLALSLPLIFGHNADTTVEHRDSRLPVP